MTGARIVPLLALLGAALLAPGPAAAQAAGEAAVPAAEARACGAPPEMVEESAAPLPATARALREGKLVVLVAGSASVFGAGTSGPAQAWPERMQAALARRHPAATVEVTVRGGRGLTAAESAGLIAAELPRLHPALVIWQTGTVDAVRGLETDQLSETLSATAAKVAAAGADLVLMDQQFSRFLRANTNIDAYRDAIRLVAAAHGAPLLRRYDLMRFWAETDRVDLERAPREMRAVVADRLNACLADALALLLRHGIAEARGKTAGAARP